MKTPNIQQSLVKSSNESNILKKILKLLLEHLTDLMHRLNNKRIEN
jgi:hypothetical protein